MVKACFDENLEYEEINSYNGRIVRKAKRAYVIRYSADSGNSANTFNIASVKNSPNTSIVQQNEINFSLSNEESNAFAEVLSFVQKISEQNDRFEDLEQVLRDFISNYSRKKKDQKDTNWHY